MEINVGEEWTHDTSLRCTEFRILEQLSFHDPCPKELPDQVEELLVVDTVPEEPHQPPVVNRIEIRRDVPFDDPEVFATLRGIVHQIPDGIHRAAAWAEPEGSLTKVGLIDGFQDHANSFLNNPISNGRNAQRTSLSIRFWNVHPPYWTG